MENPQEPTTIEIDLDALRSGDLDIDSEADRITAALMRSDDPTAALDELLEGLKGILGSDLVDSDILEHAASVLDADASPLDKAQEKLQVCAIHLHLLEVAQEFFTPEQYTSRLQEVTMNFMDIPFSAIANINPLIPAKLIEMLQSDDNLAKEAAEMNARGIRCLVSAIRSAVVCGNRHNQHGIDHHGKTAEELHRADVEFMQDCRERALANRARLREEIASL